MDKCSVLFAFLCLVSPILSDRVQDNVRILDSYCQTFSRNSVGPLEVFRHYCQGLQPVDCCNHIANQIRIFPTHLLCAEKEGYQFRQGGCQPPISNENSFPEQIVVRVAADSQIYFPSEHPNERFQQPAASAAPQVFQQSASSAPQVLLGVQEIKFNNDPQYNIQVKTSSEASVVPRRPNKPVQQNGFKNPSNLFNANNDDDDYDRAPVVEYNTRGYQAMNFALNLFKNLDRPANRDAVISPLLPQQLLANLGEYSNAVTQNQLQSTVLLHPQQLADMTRSFDKISKSSVNTIETASANFVAKDVQLNKTYRSDVQVRNVKVFNVDFSQPNQAARTANKWVSEKTHKLINEILNPGAINSYTRLLLTNTIYFKGKWKYTFIETRPGMFESTPNNPRQLNTMFQLNKLRYGELNFSNGNGLRWVELPYEGGDLAMLVFLPTKRHQLEASLRQLEPQDLARVMADLQTSYINTKVHLTMPKFTLTDSVSLVPALKRMGLTSIFQDPDALLYLTNESTVVSDVTQRSFMSVDEFGTKATSVASLSIITLSVTPQYKDVRFDVDQPFLVMIVDKQERYPFFIGQIYDPTE